MFKFLFVVLIGLCLVGFLSCTKKNPCSLVTDDTCVDKMPQLIRRVDSEYPPLARAAGIEGIIGVKFWIDEMGRVISAEIRRSSGATAGFEDASISPGRKTLWIPAYSRGRPIPYWSYYEVIFICCWIHVEKGKQLVSESRRQEEVQKALSDSAIEIHEIYDTPSSIEKTVTV
jgi:TonB family protein